MGARASSLCSLNACFPHDKNFSSQQQMPFQTQTHFSPHKANNFINSQATECSKPKSNKLEKLASYTTSNTDPLNQVTQDVHRQEQKYVGVAQKTNKQSEAVKKKEEFQHFQYTVLGLIGQGHFSKVILVETITSMSSPVKMAMKVVDKKKVDSPDLEKSLRLEEYILDTFESKFLTRSYGSHSDDDNFYLAMEWAEGGDSYSFIKRSSRRKQLFKQAGESGLRFLLGCVILGLEALHKRGVLYIDLKPENVLLFRDGYAKLADFGLSKDIATVGRTHVQSGSPLYMAPQVICEVKCGLELDIWTLGIIAYELSNAAPPFSSQSISSRPSFIKTLQNFHAKRAWHNKNASQNLKDFVHSLLRASPIQRLGAQRWEEIKEHSFFKDVNFDWNGLESKQMQSPLLPVLEEAVEVRALKVSKLLFAAEVSKHGK